MGKLPTNLELRFFTDRVSYPHQFTRLVKDGMLADVIPETELKKSEWIREIEASVIITLDLAEKLHLRLGEWIKNQKKVSDENKVVS